ncbi:Ribose 5-phosphate isomerase A [Colletotrichum scovillei]|uniref:Ribose 5-phosphate isomerase A n=2 Tax=Colletotrichum scovillei TaxID=1209932 RepID=A0A9P7R846_9PEZI|nr:Ribose 5-phosphate isomerase A [Colletotrichum scovillei]KAG7070935.1 Ribose 5-phosphate isomerase A [Colletotrichum scovillei]KAG7079181.1 Ribose 5-phosphate isomerase A [Colletotrichum scovillei]
MACFIYINGYPGVGKLTVASALSKLIPRSRVFHNHLVIDPVAAMLDRDDAEAYNDLRTTFRRHALDTIATHPALADKTFIFTDARESGSLGSEAAQDYKAAAEKRGVPFISVVLHCDVDENVRRLGGRRSTGVDEAAGNTKLTDGEILRKIREDETIFQFGDENEMCLDVTNLKPDQSALLISQHVNAVHYSLDKES